jgi:hypothetical protein
MRVFNIFHKHRNKSVTRQTQSESEVTLHLAHKRWNFLVLSINIKTASILVLMGYVTSVTGGWGSNPTLFLYLSFINIFVLLYGNSEYTGSGKKPDDFQVKIK